MSQNQDELLDNESIEEESGELYEHFRIVVDQGQEQERIDVYMTNHLSNVSRNRVQNAARAGNILVNEKVVKSNYKVKPNDVISIVFTYPPRDADIKPQEIPLDIVYEDDDVLVVNKPAGLVVHPGVGNWTGTLLNALAHHFKADPRYDINNPEIGLVHRIDKDTSGLLVIAKTPAAKTSLGLQFFNKTTRREYNALVWGTFDHDDGRIEGNIGRNPKDRLQMTVLPPEDECGKPAVTHYHVLERFAYTTLVRCVLETGRTHQIRVHMRHIGHTLFNDERYGGDQLLRGTPTAKYRQFVENCFKACPRQALHARTLGFVHPTTGQELYFTSELPADLDELITRWRNYTAAKE